MKIAGKHDTRCFGHVLKSAASQLRWATRGQCARSALVPLRVKAASFDLGPSAIYAAVDNPDALRERAASADAEIVMGSPTKRLREFAAAISRATCRASAPTATAAEPAGTTSVWIEAGRMSGQRVSRPQAGLRETHDGKPAPACPPSHVRGGAGGTPPRIDGTDEFTHALVGFRFMGTSPGEGVVLQDIGRIVYSPDEEQILFLAGQHNVPDEGFEAELCAALS